MIRPAKRLGTLGYCFGLARALDWCGEGFRLQKQRFDTEEMDLSIQWSLLTRISAAASAYQATSASGTNDSLTRYLSALESLAEYVATRCRGAALFAELCALEEQDVVVQLPTRSRRREPRLIEFTPKAEVQGCAAPDDGCCESMAG